MLSYNDVIFILGAILVAFLLIVVLTMLNQEHKESEEFYAKLKLDMQANRLQLTVIKAVIDNYSNPGFEPNQQKD